MTEPKNAVLGGTAPIATNSVTCGSKSLACRFHELFAGLERAHGTYGDLDQTREDGKRTGKAITVREAVTDELWAAHLAGKTGIGIVPIRDDASCVFGAIDIDQYADLDHARIAGTVARLELPLVVCRSKSGGCHLYLFASQPVDSGRMQDRLRDIAAKLGHGTAEIFPKQRKLMPKECGGWINSVYFNGDAGNRYAVNAQGDALSMEQFLALAESLKVGPEFFEPAAASSVPEPLPGGPPCLQHLVQLGFPEGCRNNALLALGIYAKHRSPDAFEVELEQFNRDYMKPPLASSEVMQTVKSLRKTDYTYPCNKDPLAAHCNAPVCRTRRYGIGGGTAASLPVLGSLTKYDSLPPLYWWDVDGHRIELTTDEIRDYRLFRRVCFERLDKVLPGMKATQWDEVLRKQMETMSTEPVPEDASPEGQFWEVLEQFCHGRAQASCQEDVLLGKPWTDENRTYFTLNALIKYLGRVRFNYLTMQRIAAVMKSRGGQPERLTIKGKVVRAWSVPAFKRPTDEEWPVPGAVGF